MISKFCGMFAAVMAIGVAILLLPEDAAAQGSIQFQVDGNTPPSTGCPDSEVWYTLAWPGTTIADNSISITVTGNYTSLGSVLSSESKTFKIKWASSGSISVNFTHGTQQTLGPINFSMTNTSVGTISGPSAVCYGTSGTLSVTGNAGAVTWTYHNGSSWVNLGSSSTGDLTSARDFQATYTAGGCAVSYSNIITVGVTPLVNITSGPSLNPTSRYVGDTDPIAASVTATNASSYTWTAKDASNQAVATPSTTGATPSFTGWSSTYSGNVVVAVTAHGCNGSTDTESTNFTINPIPIPNFNITNSLPSTHCAGIEVHYILISSDPNVTLSNVESPVITGGGSNVQSIDTNEWSVNWTSDGSIAVTYDISKDGRTWQDQQVSQSFNIDEAIAGTISFSGPSTMCSGTSQTSGTINITGNSGAATYWSCTTGCSSANDTGWTQMESTAYTSLSTNTKFRAKLTNQTCGVKYSNTLDATVAPMPTDILVNGPAGVCESSANAKIVLNYGESAVRYLLFKNSVDQNYEIEGPGPTETGGRIEFVNQGAGTYHVIAKKGTCELQMTGTPTVQTLTQAAFSVTTDPVQPISICPGASVSLQAVNGASLQWSSTLSDLTTEQTTATSLTVSPAGDATYSVTGVDVNCRLPVSQSVVVDIRNAPTVTFDPSIPATVCVSTPGFQLAASPSGGSWKVNGNSSSQTFTAADFHPTPTQESSSHSIQYVHTDSYGCVWTSSALQITIKNPQPPQAATFAAEYDEPFLASVGAGTNESYKWYTSQSGGSPVATGTSYETPPIVVQKVYYLAKTRADLTSCEGTLRAPITINPLPANNYNYVREEIMLDDGVTTISAIDGLTIDEKSMTTNYIDGLGRPLQTVNWKASPGRYDMIQPVEYDLIGREVKKFLPYAADQTNGWLRKRAIKDTNYANSEQALFYLNNSETIASDPVPYALTIFEESPLNRVLEQGAPGSDWQPVTTDHTITKHYELNVANEVLLFNVDPTGAVYLTPGSGSYYTANTLYRNKTFDEHQNDVVEYMDNEGRTVCKKVNAGNNVYAWTYYIYDDFGNLVTVIPPEGVKEILAAINP